jgi:hypothetical protein
MQLIGPAVSDVTRVRNDGVRSQRGAELHGVLERGEGLDPLLGIIDGQHSEIWSMNGNGDTASGCFLPKGRTTTFVPWKPGDKWKFDGAMAAVDQRVKPFPIIAVGGWEPGNPKSNHLTTEYPTADG